MRPLSTGGTEVVSLRAFHLLFIALSVVLCAFCGAWALGAYRTDPQGILLVTAVGCLVVAGGLAAYGTVFQRKTRQL